MMTYQNHFHRQEKKYLLDEDKYRTLLAMISNNIKYDQHGTYRICNLYFDTMDFDLIRRSISKPLYKEKFRIRSYGTPDMDTIVHLEIKKKYDGVIYKRRISMPYKDAMNYCVKGLKPKRNDQIFREVDRVMERYPLYPMIYISYHRTAVQGVREKDLRITFDSQLLWRNTDLDLTCGSYGNCYFQNDEIIMEIKTNGGMPLWLSHALNNLKIYPQSFSKYGNIYQHEMANRLEQ